MHVVAHAGRQVQGALIPSHPGLYAQVIRPRPQAPGHHLARRHQRIRGVEHERRQLRPFGQVAIRLHGPADCRHGPCGQVCHHGQRLRAGQDGRLQLPQARQLHLLQGHAQALFATARDLTPQGRCGRDCPRHLGDPYLHRHRLCRLVHQVHDRCVQIGQARFGLER